MGPLTDRAPHASAGDAKPVQSARRIDASEVVNTFGFAPQQHADALPGDAEGASDALHAAAFAVKRPSQRPPEPTSRGVELPEIAPDRLEDQRRLLIVDDFAPGTSRGPDLMKGVRLRNRSLDPLDVATQRFDQFPKRLADVIWAAIHGAVLPDCRPAQQALHHGVGDAREVRPFVPREH